MTDILDCGICLVRPLVRGDAESLAAHGNEREIWLNLRDRFPHPYRVEDALAYIDAVSSQEPVTSFAIEVDGEACGGVSLDVGSDIERRSAELGYWLGRAHWGRGVMSAAVRAVTEHAFGTLDLLRVWAVPFACNVASHRVLEKAGFVREGLLRSSALKAGEVLDEVMYARVRS